MSEHLGKTLAGKVAVVTGPTAQSYSLIRRDT